MPTAGENKRLCRGRFGIKFMLLIAFIHSLTRPVTHVPEAHHCVACKNTLFVNPWLTGHFFF
jgi:hypothetical protein